MTGRHTCPTFDVQTDGTDPWPFIITADGEPTARVTDRDTAAATVALAVQIAREGFDPQDAITRALEDHQDDDAEGRIDWPGWVSWPDWLDRIDYDQGA